MKAVAQVSKSTTRVSPVRGLNSYDSIASMDEGFALVLRNIFAQPYGCQVRRGYVRHCSVDGNAETVFSHNVLQPKLYAFVAGELASELVDVSTPNVAPVSKETGLSNARWQCINFPNVAGVNGICVNGTDDLLWIHPDGTTSFVLEGDGTENTIKGIDPKKFIHVYSHQKRLWFTEKDSTRGWYLPPEQMFGEAKSFDFGAMWVRGGYLNQIITWTIDDGNGADDHLMAISSEGEVSVFQGIDPNDASTWSLQGVYFAGAPVGRRSAVRYGGDVILLSQFGMVLMSDLLKSTKVNPSEENIAKYIQQTISSAVSATGHEFGWEPFVFPGANMVMINVPFNQNSQSQLVMNDITKSWSQFIGYNALCWELYQQLPIFGSQNAIMRAWEQHTDGATVSDTGVVTQGTTIRSEAQTTFSYFGDFGVQKHYKMVRPTIMSRGQFSLSLACNVDFILATRTAPVSYEVPNLGLWDESLWGTVMWEGGLGTYKRWISVTGIGTAASLRLLLQTSSETYWTTTDWLYETGGVM